MPDRFTPLSSPPESGTAPLKSWFQAERTALIQRTQSTRWGLHLSRQITHLVDMTLTRLLQSAPLPGQSCILATGSFGRFELSPHSDIDIVFLVQGAPSAAEKSTIERMIRLCWDFGLPVSHSVRTARDYLHLSQTDFVVLTTVFDLRFVAGNQDYAREFQTLAWQNMSDPGKIVHAIESVWSDRRRKFGVAHRLLEPNTKESGGGLRDVHNACWLVQLSMPAVRFDPDPSSSTILERAVSDPLLLPAQSTDLHQAFNFIQKVRNALHHLAGRKQDVLTYDMQQKLSVFLGYDQTKSAGVEQFMQEFLTQSRVVHALATSLKTKAIQHLLPVRPAAVAAIPVDPPFQVRRVDDHSVLEYDGQFEAAVSETPELMMRAFLLATKFHADPSETLQLTIRDHLHRLDDHFLSNRTAALDFCALWKYEGQIGHGLRWMHELGFLERYLPEFGYIVAHYKYNVYHAYTTDEHLIVTVEKLESLFVEEPEVASRRRLREIYDDLSLFEKNQLYWGAFLHDIGKARNRDHTEVGAELAVAIFQRLGYSDSTGFVLELIRQHLRMEQIAFRRDLRDNVVIRDFADQVRDRRFLRLLYLLTYADMSASNASVWTEWKAALLHELFQKTDAWLRDRDVDKTLSDVPDYESFPMPAGVDAIFEDAGHHTTATVTTPDRPYCLANICGVFTACDISIFNATVHTRQDGLVIDRFHVVNYSTGKLLSAEQKTRCRELLHQTLIDGRPIEPLIQKVRNKWKRRQRPSSVVPEVYFEKTARFTIIDVFAPDRVGLLYEITHALAGLGLVIHTAKIGTRLDGVADCFYVRNSKGERIERLDEQDTVRKTLLKAIR